MFNSYIPHLRILTQCSNICLTIRGKLLSTWWSKDIIPMLRRPFIIHKNIVESSHWPWFENLCFSLVEHIIYQLTLLVYPILMSFISISLLLGLSYVSTLNPLTIILLFSILFIDYLSTLKHLFHNNLFKRKINREKAKTLWSQDNHMKF